MVSYIEQKEKTVGLIKKTVRFSESKSFKMFEITKPN